MKTSVLTMLLAVYCCTQLCAQGVGISNQSNQPPNPQAMLDLSSTNKGFLPPRLNAVQRNNLASSLTALQIGLEVADSATGHLFTWSGESWNGYGVYSAAAPLYEVVASTNQVALNAGTAVGDLITWDGNNWVSMQPAPLHFSLSYDNQQPYIIVNYCIALQGVFPARNGDEPFVAEIQPFAFNFAPIYYAFCNGQLMPISQNTALFSLLGTYYGGNGVNNFALPDLRGRVALDFGQAPGLTERILGETGGTETNNVNQ